MDNCLEKVEEGMKFVDYGCYCTPSGQKNGEMGEPVDEIDALCRDLFMAYKCLKNDHLGCAADTKYQW